MLKLTSLPLATVVKMAPDGASALAVDALSASGNAAAAATISQRMCVLRIPCPPQVLWDPGRSHARLTSSRVDRPLTAIRVGAIAPLPPSESAERDVDRRLLSLVGRPRS